MVRDYDDVLTAEALVALEALVPFDRKAVMAGRLARRSARARMKQRIDFLDPDAKIARTEISVAGCTRRTLRRSGDPC